MVNGNEFVKGFGWDGLIGLGAPKHDGKSELDVRIRASAEVEWKRKKQSVDLVANLERKGK